MSQYAADAVRPNAPEPFRVGILLADLGGLNISVLKYLITHLNTLQRMFEFEFFNIDSGDPLIKLLRKGERVDRNKCRSMLKDFHERISEQLNQDAQNYDLVEKSLPSGFVIITRAGFTDGHYGLKSENIQVMALGDWERYMSPPSVFEFILILLIRQAIGLSNIAFSKSIHLGTKGCLFDFTDELSDARYKALQGFICSICLKRLEDNGLPHVADELGRVLGMNWLGKIDDPLSPAGIARKLGYNLFLTQGIKPTLWESIKATLRDEGSKEVIKMIGLIIGALLLFWLGLKSSK